MRHISLLGCTIIATFVFSVSCNSVANKADSNMDKREVASGSLGQNHHAHFLKAVETGDLDYVKWQLKAWSFKGGLGRVDINYQNEDGRTALMLAFLNSHFEIAKTILNARCESRVTHRCAGKIDINMQDNKGHTAFMMALVGVFSPSPSLDKNISDRLVVVENLLKRPDIDFGLRDVQNRTVLAIAVDLGNRMNHVSLLRTQIHELMIKYILDNATDKGILVNVADNQGNTPLMIAARNGYPGITSLLLTHNADPNLKNNEGMTALALAERNRNKDVIEILTPVTSVDIN